MSFRNLLRKAANLVVELPDEPPSYDPSSISTDSAFSDPVPAPTQRKTVEQIVRDSPGPNLDEIKVQPDPVAAAAAPGGKVDFADIYRKAGLPTAPFTAEQALDVMASLPADLPLDVRRTTVQATLKTMGKAMGVNTESVLADASRKLAALTSYGEALELQTTQYNAAAEAKIADLERQIAEHRNSVENVKHMLSAALALCQTESKRLDDVLEFFTSDIPPSRNAEAK